MGKAFFKRDDVNRVWAAVLLQACEDIVEATDTSKPATKECLRRQALAWVTSTRTDTCSFMGVCSSLGINPHNARYKILQLPRGVSRCGKRLASLLMLEFEERKAKSAEEMRIYG